MEAFERKIKMLPLTSALPSLPYPPNPAQVKCFIYFLEFLSVI